MIQLILKIALRLASADFLDECSYLVARLVAYFSGKFTMPERRRTGDSYNNDAKSVCMSPIRVYNNLHNRR